MAGVQAHERRATVSVVMAGLGLAGAAATVMLWWRAEGGTPGGGLGGSALALSLGRLAGLLAGFTLIAQLLLAARLPALERFRHPEAVQGEVGLHERLLHHVRGVSFPAPKANAVRCATDWYRSTNSP